MSEQVFSSYDLLVLCSICWACGYAAKAIINGISSRIIRDRKSKTNAELKPQPARLWAVYIASQQRPDGRS